MHASIIASASAVPGYLARSDNPASFLVNHSCTVAVGASDEKYTDPGIDAERPGPVRKSLYDTINGCGVGMAGWNLSITMFKGTVTALIPSRSHVRMPSTSPGVAIIGPLLTIHPTVP